MSRAMKDSGIPWIGEIPKDWSVIRIRHIFDIIGGNGFKDKYQGVSCGDYPFYKTSDINGDLDYVSQSSNYVNKDIVAIENYNIVPSDSIIVSKIGAAMRKNHRKISMCDCCIDNNLEALRPIRNDNVKYLYYLLKIINFEWFDNNGTIPSVNNAKLRDFYVPWVPLAEQQWIAEFLDRKCAEVDEMIALQEQIIEELKAYKQSVITEAVTKGLNPNVPMKDSGIDWIDYVPHHWQIRKIKSLIDLKSGSNLTSMDISDKENGYLVYGGNGVRGTYVDYSHEGEYVLIGRQGALCGNINYTSGKFWVTEHALVCHPKEKCELKWLGESLRAMNLNQYSLSAAQPGLSAERIRNIYMIVPPITEQKDIAEHLNTKCSEIDNLISIKLSKIDSLKEYKKSIIYEYVTGKKEVIE